MRLSLSPLLLLALVAATCTYALPTSNAYKSGDSSLTVYHKTRKGKGTEHTLKDYHKDSDTFITNAHYEKRGNASSARYLITRDIDYPVQPNAALVAKIIASVKVDLDVKVFASITATLSEKVAASISARVSLLGGLVSVGDTQLKVIQSSVIQKLKASFDAQLKAKIDVAIYAELEITLKQLLGSSPLDKIKFLEILTELEVKAQALIAVRLPTIGAGY